MKLMQDYSNVNNMQWRNEWALSSETRKWLLDPMIYMDSSHFLSKTRLTLSGHCSHFIPPKNPKKPKMRTSEFKLSRTFKNFTVTYWVKASQSQSEDTRFDPH